MKKRKIREGEFRAGEGAGNSRSVGHLHRHLHPTTLQLPESVRSKLWKVTPFKLTCQGKHGREECPKEEVYYRVEEMTSHLTGCTAS